MWCYAFLRLLCSKYKSEILVKTHKTRLRTAKRRKIAKRFSGDFAFRPRFHLSIRRLRLIWRQFLRRSIGKSKLGLVSQLNRYVCLSAPQSGALVSKTSTRTGAKKRFYYSIKKSFSYVSPALSEILSGEKSLSGKPLESVNSVSQSAVIKTLTSPFKRASRTFTPQRVRQ